MGVEIDPSSAAQAERVYNRVHTEPIESAIGHLQGPFDLILCADVLEHLVDPWHVLDRLRLVSMDHTRLAVSIPNIRHLRAIWRIAAGAGFEYEQRGTFDATHLRFFTRRNIASMLTATGWRPERWGSAYRSGRAKTAARLARGSLDEWLTYQWWVLAGRV